MNKPLPLIILAGSDTRLGPVAPGVRATDMLVGPKGALRLPGGNTLIGELLARFQASGRFQRPILVGPARVYHDKHLDCEIVDASGSLATTLQRTMETIAERFGISAPIAVSACDILPTADELCELLSTGYDPVRECLFWWQMVESTPVEMGASGWKNRYRFRAEHDGTIDLYPGHLMIIRPEALRTEVMIRLLHLAYRYRNRPLLQRAIGINLRGLGILVWQDLCNLRRFQLPTLTFSIPYHCWLGYSRYWREQLTLNGLEHLFTKIFVHRDFHHVANNRPVVVSTCRIRSLARDLDTKAEFEEAVRQTRNASAQSEVNTKTHQPNTQM